MGSWNKKTRTECHKKMKYNKVKSKLNKLLIDQKRPENRKKKIKKNMKKSKTKNNRKNKRKNNKWEKIEGKLEKQGEQEDRGLMLVQSRNKQIPKQQKNSKNPTNKKIIVIQKSKMTLFPNLIKISMFFSITGRILTTIRWNNPY